MPTLHALFIAIDQYPNPHHTLQGCVADMVQFHDYLKTHCERMGLTFRPLVLADEQAKRDTVITAFEHFQAAQTGDQCLFFYAGHGARSAAPEMFWKLEADKKIESLVCWDSRQPGGHDLMDKELSYLVWEAMRDKDMPLITITDCCHSGSLRNIVNLEPLRIREIRDLGSALPAEQYHGFQHYKQGSDGQVSPPQGRRIHLGAARDLETAKEVRVNGVTRGIFTHCLVQALQAAGPLVSYTELLDRVHLRVRANIADQSPQLQATFAKDKNLRFLSTTMEEGIRTYLVTYDPKFGWILNAGAIHGLSAGDPASRTLLELVADRTAVTVTEVMPDASRVEGLEGRDKTQVYPVVVVRRAVPKLEAFIAPDSDAGAVSALQQCLEQSPTDFFQLGSNNSSAGFTIHARDNALWMTRLCEERPLFQRVRGYDPAAIKVLLKRIEVVANWRQILDLSNFSTGILDEEIAIVLYRVVDPGNEENDAPVEVVDRSRPADFFYVEKGRQWYKPAFQMKIRNTGRRPLWISLLYFSCDFSITNQLLPKQLLAPGEEAWAQDVFEGEVFRTIPLAFDEAYRQQGIKFIEEYFKLLICTEELNTDSFNQKGLDPDTGSVSPTRSLDLRCRTQPEKRDWRAKEIKIAIIRDAVGTPVGTGL